MLARLHVISLHSLSSGQSTSFFCTSHAVTDPDTFSTISRDFPGVPDWVGHEHTQIERVAWLRLAVTMLGAQEGLKKGSRWTSSLYIGIKAAARSTFADAFWQWGTPCGLIFMFTEIYFEAGRSSP